MVLKEASLKTTWKLEYYNTPAYLPSFSFWGAIEWESVFYPAIDVTESHHALGGTANGQCNERCIGQRWLVRPLFGRVI